MSWHGCNVAYSIDKTIAYLCLIFLKSFVSCPYAWGGRVSVEASLTGIRLFTCVGGWAHDREQQETEIRVRIHLA